MRRIHELVGLIVAAFAFAPGGLQPCGAAEPAPRDGGSLIMATSAQVQGFDPLTTRAANRERKNNERSGVDRTARSTLSRSTYIA